MAENNRTEWYLQVIDARTGKPVDDDNGKVQVLTAGAPTNVTVYSGATDSAAATQPLSLSNGAVQYYTEESVTSVDLSVVSKGVGAFIQDFTPSDHSVEIDQSGGISQIVIPYGATGSSEVDSGLTIEGPTQILLVRLAPVTAAGSGALIDVGTSTPDDPDGLIDGVDINSTANNKAAFPATVTSVATGTSTTVTYMRGDSTNGTGTGYIVLHVASDPIG